MKQSLTSPCESSSQQFCDLPDSILGCFHIKPIGATKRHAQTLNNLAHSTQNIIVTLYILTVNLKAATPVHLTSDQPPTESTIFSSIGVQSMLQCDYKNTEQLYSLVCYIIKMSIHLAMTLKNNIIRFSESIVWNESELNNYLNHYKQVKGYGYYDLISYPCRNIIFPPFLVDESPSQDDLGLISI